MTNFATSNHAYCGWEHVESRASILGARNLTDDKGKGVADPQIKADCIEMAVGEIDLAIGLRYPPSELMKDVNVKWWCAILALAAVAQRRMLAMPAALVAECQRIRALMLEIKLGRQSIPGLAELMLMTPEVVNVTVDKRPRDSKVRIQPALSSQGITTAGTNVHIDGDIVVNATNFR